MHPTIPPPKRLRTKPCRVCGRPFDPAYWTWRVLKTPRGTPYSAWRDVCTPCGVAQINAYAKTISEPARAKAYRARKKREAFEAKLKR